MALKADLESPVAAPGVALLDAQIADAFGRLGRLAGDMTRAELEYAGPQGDRNSTASLLAHLAQVDLGWLCFLQGREAPADIGPSRDEAGRIPVVTGRTAGELLARYGEVQDQLHAYTAALTDADLPRLHDPLNPAWRGSQASTRWVLWHLAEHSILHQAHIGWLKAWARGQA